MRQNKPLKSSKGFVLLLKLQFWHFFSPPCLSFQRVFQAKRYLRPTWMIFEKTWFCKNDISSREIWLSRFMLTCHYIHWTKQQFSLFKAQIKLYKCQKKARKTSECPFMCILLAPSNSVLNNCKVHQLFINTENWEWKQDR